MYDKTKTHFINKVKSADPQLDILLRHVPIVEKWAKKLLKMNPTANDEIVLLGVWLHDIGNVVGDKDIDHAINSETEVKQYLKEIGTDEDTISKVAHCVRAHRCKDVQPNTLEAKIVAAADSASHMTDIIYIDMVNQDKRDKALQKLERDYRDISIFPELQTELTPFYEAWKNLLKLYPGL